MTNSDARYAFTGQFLKASAIFVRRARTIEATASLQTDETTRSEHRGLVTSVIMQCVAALETEAHETCEHGPGSYLGSSGTNSTAQDFLRPIAALVDNQSVLTRFDLILHLLQLPPLNKGSNPYQSVALVVRLRNELTHYKSRWDTEIESSKLFAALQSLGHKPAPFTAQGMNFFPHQCLSADCAAWALSSVVAFLESFYSALGVPSRFADYDEQLVP